MSDTAGQPWWADVQHLRPSEDGGNKRTRESADPAERGRTGRFARRETVATGAATATAVATEAIPRLVDIDWQDFVAAHADAEPRIADPRDRGRWTHDDAGTPGTDPLDALDFDPTWPTTWDEPRRDPRTGRRTVEIRGRVDRAATAPVDEPVVVRSQARRHMPRHAGDRFQGRPDRVAMWAFVLGGLLMIVAAFSSPEADAATRLPVGY